MGKINLSDLYDDVSEEGRESAFCKWVQSRQSIQRTENFQSLEGGSNKLSHHCAPDAPEGALWMELLSEKQVRNTFFNSPGPCSFQADL